MNMTRTTEISQLINETPEGTDLLDTVDTLRRETSATLNMENRAELGQFMTPAVVARFMASLFKKPKGGQTTLLDAGAGMGGLSAAFLERHVTQKIKGQVTVTAYEIDDSLREELARTLSGYQRRIKDFSVEIHAGDFIEEAVNRLQLGTGRQFSHAILNPPYRKINTDSIHRKLLRLVGIETVNLYTAFVALTLKLMHRGGEIVAIIPRSFCNGPYYRPFRKLLLESASIEQIHLFDSRTSVFSDDAVLQENIIIRLIVGGGQRDVVVSHSSDKTLSDLVEHRHSFASIVFPDDAERFIHIPQGAPQITTAGIPNAETTLADLGLKVSTGPVVDFRLKDFLLTEPEKGSVPLLYANHFVRGELMWPREGKKANAIKNDPKTTKWLYPNNGFYTVLRRFSSKEEKRRVVAYIVDPKIFGKATLLGLENHLNVFHLGRNGLEESVARGLAVYLNSTAVDTYFRRFSGHTQVNATDLRNLKYPSLAILKSLGKWAVRQPELSQDLIDVKFPGYEG